MDPEDDFKVFPNDKKRIIASKKILKVLDADIECEHSSVFTDPSSKTGSGYCRMCGIPFSNGSPKSQGRCTHSTTQETDNGLHVCVDCGVELEVFDNNPEWRVYNGDTFSNRDPSRCHKMKVSDFGITKEFEARGLQLPEAIIKRVVAKYAKVTGGDRIKGNGRVALIAACLFYSYRDIGENRTAEYIYSIVKVTSSDFMAALNRYYTAFPEDAQYDTRPQDLLKWMMRLVGFDESSKRYPLHYKRLMRMIEFFEYSSQILARSSPQSLTAAVLYFYFCLNKKLKKSLNMTKAKFVDDIRLSDITISKLVKETSRIANVVVKM